MATHVKSRSVGSNPNVTKTFLIEICALLRYHSAYDVTLSKVVNFDWSRLDSRLLRINLAICLIFQVRSELEVDRRYVLERKWL